MILDLSIQTTIKFRYITLSIFVASFLLQKLIPFAACQSYPKMDPIETKNNAQPCAPKSSDECSQGASSASATSSSAKSPTSTAIRTTEPFWVYSQRVERLCKVLWPPHRNFMTRYSDSQLAVHMRRNRFLCVIAPSEIRPLIKYLHSGTFNRITAITLPKSYRNIHRELVLRVPRDRDSRPDRAVALLDYVRRSTSIPVPFVVATDCGVDNPLAWPYVLQHRVSGTDLSKGWETLCHSQKCIVAKEIGIVVRKLLALESQRAGIVDVESDESKIVGGPNIIPFELDGADTEIIEAINLNRTDMTSPQTTLDLFEFLIKRWRQYDHDRSGRINYAVRLWDRMAKTVREMNDLGLLGSNANCLCHVDLSSQHVMVKVRVGQSPEVTAILDWDKAIFAPKFMNCDPPRWLWDNTKIFLDEHGLWPWPYELPGANEAPPHPDKLELKRIFEEAAGSEYCALAYEDHYRVCRVMLRVAISGLDDSMDFKALERIFREWDRIRDNLAEKR